MSSPRAGGPARTGRWALPVLAVPTGLLGVSLAWQLTGAPGPSSIVRAGADLAGAVTLGLALLPRLAGSRPGRAVVAPDRVWRALAVVAAVWTVAEASLLFIGAADVAQSTLGGLGLDSFAAYLTDIQAGRVGLIALACTTVVVGSAVAGFRGRSTLSPEPVAAIAAVALVLRPATGHMSQQTLGPVLGAVHVLAAAAWVGALAALAIVLRSRSEWASALPRYSAAALWCVAVLTVTGGVNAAVRLGSASAFVDTGYGRVVLAKAVLLGVLVALGWWWRRTWVVSARSHRVDADVSLRRAIVDVAVGAIAFGLAAALAATPLPVPGNL